MALDCYAIGKVIGKGSYGMVSLVKHVKDRKQYVIKKVDLQKASSRERQSAELEAKLLSKLRHPNIVSYRESFQDDEGFLYIVMNFCEGGDLYTKLKSQKGKLLEETQIVEWFVQIAMALQYMHERHILHRDLKTQNIFLTKSGIIKVGDLGIAKVLESSSDMATTLIGTPYYMSPELFSNKPYNHKSDVWALGCVLYETCTLRHAFNARDMNSLVYKILKGKIPAMPKQYSDELCAIIKTMLEQEPEKRPSVSRLLRHPYIKQQIALFLEGTKSRQKQRKSSGNRLEKKSVEVSPAKKNSSVKSNSSHNSANNQSIATVSAVNCVFNGEPSFSKPAKDSTHDSDSGRASVESASSSGSSEKGQTEIHVGAPRSGGVKKDNSVQKLDKNDRKTVNVKQRPLSQDERRKELIKKQIQEKRRQNNAEKNAKSEQVKHLEKQARGQNPKYFEKKGRPQSSSPGEEKPARIDVRNGENSKFDSHFPSKYSRYQRPLPKPPRNPPGEVPLSKSPRTRRRYKVASAQAKSHAAEEDEEEKERRSSVDSDKSDRSSVSVSESTHQSSGLTARERRRLKQKSAGIRTPPVVQVLPSPREVLTAQVVHDQATPPLVGVSVETKATPPTGNVSVEPRRQLIAGVGHKHDGRRKSSRSESLDAVDEETSDSTGSELEEISLDEPTPSQKRKARKESDVSCLISALDTTLKLSTPDRDSPEMEQEEEEEKEDDLKEKLVGVDVPDGASPTTSGRLRDRIEKLRRDCIGGIGVDVLKQACNIIDTNDEDNVEEALVRLMGQQNFERYGGRIWQLKFCESFR